MSLFVFLPDFIAFFSFVENKHTKSYTGKVTWAPKIGRFGWIAQLRDVLVKHL